MAYMLYRVWYPEAWSEGSRELDIVLGGFNTVVLIGSSLTMALAVRAAQTGKQRATVVWLLAHDGARPRRSWSSSSSSTRTSSSTTTFPARTSSSKGRRPDQVADLLLALLRADRPARAAHGHRLRASWRHRVDGAQEAVLAGVVHAGRDAAASTGTSSTSSGFSCSRCCISWTGPHHFA